MRARVCIATALLLALTGCSGNDDPGAGPSDDPETSSVASEPSGSEASDGSTTTEDPGVEPADGPLVKGQFLTYRLPGGMKWDRSPGFAFAFDPKTGGQWSISLAETPENIPHTVDDIARNALDVSRDTYSDLRRLDDRTVDGQQGWVLESHGKKGGSLPVFFYQFGAVPDGKSYAYLSFEFPKETAETRAAIESVLASVRWRS